MVYGLTAPEPFTKSISPGDLMDTDPNQIRAAQEIIAGSYDLALKQGLPPEIVANAALATAIGLMVQVHGAENVATMLPELSDQVRAGVFTHE